jgi:hypothetical protein
MRHKYLLELVWGAFGAIALVGGSGVARADAAPQVMTTGAMTAPEQLLVNPYTIDLGTFVVSSKVNGNLRGTIQNESNVDFSQDFGTDASENRVRADFLWRIASRHQIRFAYFNDAVSRTRQISQDINWGDNTYLAGGLVTAETKFTVYEANYEYAFIKDRDYDVLVTAGVHVEDYTLKLAGNATVTPPGGGPPSTAQFESQSNSVTAPLPVVGLRGDWAATEHLYLDASGQVFKFSYQGIDGNWSDIWVGATWMFNEHFGIGVAYDRFAVHVDLSKGSFNGRLNLGYQGGLIFLRGAF